MDYVVGKTYQIDGDTYEMMSINIFNKKSNKLFMLFLNIMAIVIIIASYIILTVINTFIHGEVVISQTISITPMHLVYYLLGCIGLAIFVILHEYLHGLGFRTDPHVKKKDIKYGFNKKIMCPYCECKKPTLVKSSRFSLILPVYVLVLPIIILAFILNSYFVLFIGSFLLSGSTGDFYYLWGLRKTNKEYYMYEASNVSDGMLGYYILRKI